MVPLVSVKVAVEPKVEPSLETSSPVLAAAVTLPVRPDPEMETLDEGDATPKTPVMAAESVAGAVMVPASVTTLTTPDAFSDEVSQISPEPGVAGEIAEKKPVPPDWKMVKESPLASVAPTLLKFKVPPKATVPLLQVI